MRHRTKSSQDGNKILLFGGHGGTAGEYFNDLHLLDLDTSPLNLQQLLAVGDPPSPRGGYTLTAVSVSGRPGTEVVVVFGGYHIVSGVCFFSKSLYILQGDTSVSIGDAASQHTGLTWTEPIVCAHSAEDGVPDARGGHIVVSWRGKLVLFGGGNTQHYFSDTWIMDVSVPVGGSIGQLLATWRKLEVHADVRPPARVSHTGSLVGDSLYVFGGSSTTSSTTYGGWTASTSNVFNDLWELDLSVSDPRWLENHASGTPPTPRLGHAAVVLGDRIVFSGGCGPHTADAIGKSATGQAFMPGFKFFAGGVAMLDITRRRWLPIQHPTGSVDAHNDDFDDGGVQERVWEHRTGHVMVPAQHGLLVIGGMGYNGDYQGDVLHVKLF